MAVVVKRVRMISSSEGTYVGDAMRWIEAKKLGRVLATVGVSVGEKKKWGRGACEAKVVIGKVRGLPICGSLRLGPCQSGDGAPALHTLAARGRRFEVLR
jgi:hypothetical protein